MTRSASTKYGLAICVLLAVSDIALLGTLGADDGPPVAVALVSAVLGVITLVGARMAWRGDRRGVITVIVSRAISALTGLPVFFEDDVPDWVPFFVGVFIVLTIVGVALLVGSLRRKEFSAA